MIPVCFFNLEKSYSASILKALAQCAQPRQMSCDVLMDTTKASEILSYVQKQLQVTLFFIGVNKLVSQADLTGLKLSRTINLADKGHDVVLVLKNAADLEDVLSVCSNLSGVLCIPLNSRRMGNVFSRIIRERQKARLSEMTGAAADQPLTFTSGRAMYRLNRGEIYYIQANAKKIEIVMEGNTLELYASMQDVMDIVGEDFLRCHRSYIVNKQHIVRIDWGQMLILVTGGAQVPVSRTYRDSLRDALSKKTH